MYGAQVGAAVQPLPLPRSRALVLGAFAVIYIVWGSTYLAIQWAVAAFPPFLMAGSRFLAAGLVLAAVLKARGEALAPSWEWPRAVLLGSLMLLGGNGFLSLAEQRMPTGVASLLIASVPLWIVTLEWVSRQGRPNAVVVAGLAAGFTGVGLLAGRSDGWDGPVNLGYVGLVLLGSLMWAAGSLYGRRRPSTASILASVAQQMVAGGAVLLLASFALGEWSGAQPLDFSAKAVGAWLYLVVAGSILAFSAYSWLLSVAPPSLVSTYAFVNPLVAVAIGVGYNHESLTTPLLAAAGLVTLGVACIVLGKARWPRADAGGPQRP